MSLSDLASIGSLVSGLAVLVSLVLLFFQLQQVNQQVRQAERNQQASVRQGRSTRLVDIQLARLDPGIADAWRRGLQNPDEITQTELSQYLTLCRAQFYHFEDSFFQHEEGLLNEDAFATMLAGIRATAGHPGFRAAWNVTRRLHASRFADFMDAEVARASLEPPKNQIPSVDEWRAAYAAETAASASA
jgi:hypothetical protein